MQSGPEDPGDGSDSNDNDLVAVPVGCNGTENGNASCVNGTSI